MRIENTIRAVGRRAAIIASLAAATAACVPEDTFTLRYARPELRQLARDVRIFVFSDDGAQGPPSCARLDPRGAPFGDAEARTGLEAAFRIDGAPDRIPDLTGVPLGRHTLVVEAWSARCDDVGTNGAGGTFCRSTSGPSTVLRGYFCQPLSLSADRRLDIVADLTPLAELGSVFQLPESRDQDNPISRYDASNPQPIAETQVGRFPFRVQLIDDVGNDVDGTLVRWQVDEGNASFQGESTVESGQDPVLLGQGIAAATVRADLGAAATNDGRIAVSAYAPGYENAPFQFFAKAVPTVRLSTEQVNLPRSLVNLEATDPAVSPVVYADLDDNGRPDVVTVAGFQVHQVVVLYDTPGGFVPRVSTPQPRMARGLAVAQSGPSGPIIVISAARREALAMIDTPDGRTFPIEDPVIELWDAFRSIGEAPTVERGPIVRTDMDGTPIQKTAISLDAGDIDGDGYDEIVGTRCSYIVRGENREQTPVSLCYGGSVTDRTDSEIAVLSAVTNANDDVIDYRQRAVISYFGLPGGFRTVRFIDLNGDGSLDIIANNAVQVLGRCGARNQPSTGFGFAVPEPGFIVDTGFSQNFGLAAGRFTDDRFADVVSTGAVRGNSSDAGFTMIPGADCQLPSRLPAIVSGPRTSAHLLDVKTADVNADGWDDVLLLHRSERQLQIFFGAGTDALARGPVLDLSTGPSAQFDIASVGTPSEPRVRAAIPLRRENAVLFVDLTPADSGP